MAIESINPATGDLIKVYRPMDEIEVESALDEVCLAWREWRRTDLEERSALMRRVAVILRESSEEYSALMTQEMGKPIAQARGEIEKCALACEFYAEKAAAFLAPEEVETEASRSFVAFEPIGPVLAVMPWNFPFWQVFRFAAPALMAGNAGILKHASNVYGCALAIEAIFRAAGFPDHLFRTLVIGSAQVHSVIEDRRVAAVTLTGSTPAGQAVASQAGQMLKKSVLELGGSDPYVVLADADLGMAVEACVTGRLQNTGQSCIAAKRFVVVAEVFEEFQERLIEAMSAKRFGDPMDEEMDLGPMARVSLRDELHDQVTRSVEAGASCPLGGEIPDLPGAFYPPTLLTAVSAGMPAYHEELFGPVATLIRAADEAEAIMIANDTTFGLGAAVFTADIERGTEIAQKQLQAGCCFVNDFVRSDPRLPFGGIRESGYGRELGVFGIREFVNIKTVYVR